MNEREKYFEEAENVDVRPVVNGLIILGAFGLGYLKGKHRIEKIAQAAYNRGVIDAVRSIRIIVNK